MSATAPVKAGLTHAQAAAYIGVQPRTLYDYLEVDAGLRKCRLFLPKGTPRFSAKRLEKWFESRPDTAHTRAVS